MVIERHFQLVNVNEDTNGGRSLILGLGSLKVPWRIHDLMPQLT